MPKHNKDESVISPLAKQMADDIQKLEAELSALEREKATVDEQRNTLKERFAELDGKIDHQYDAKTRALTNVLIAMEKENKMLAQSNIDLGKSIESLKEFSAAVSTIITAPREISERAVKIAELQDRINTLEEERRSIAREMKKTTEELANENSKFVLLRDDKKINELNSKMTQLNQRLHLNEAGGVDVMKRKPIAELQHDITDMQQSIRQWQDQYENCKKILSQSNSLNQFLQGNPLGNLDDEKYLKSLHQRLLSQSKQADEQLKQNKGKIISNTYKADLLRNELNEYDDVNRTIEDKQIKINEKDFQLKQQGLAIDLKILDKKANLNGLKDSYEKENRQPIEQPKEKSSKNSFKTKITTVKASLFGGTKKDKLPIDSKIDHKQRGPGKGTPA